MFSARGGNPVRSYPGKRLLDLALALPAVVALAPLGALLALAVRASMGKPVLFRQTRPGLHGTPFTILKFRTMHDSRDAQGRLRADGDRLTRLGRFLRATSLDELPELVNVLRGEMSLVGPRPLVMEYMPYYRERERLRFHARPGVAGLAQVSGRNFLGWDERLELDARYVERMSFWLDVQILARTVVAVLLRRGVSPDADQAETWLHEERGAGGGVPRA
jgi:lipopolysaccharide/colanic/teichoic acid biosynthesis glycosyltransferase